MSIVVAMDILLRFLLLAITVITIDLLNCPNRRRPIIGALLMHTPMPLLRVRDRTMSILLTTDMLMDMDPLLTLTMGLLLLDMGTTPRLVPSTNRIRRVERLLWKPSSRVTGEDARARRVSVSNSTVSALALPRHAVPSAAAKPATIRRPTVTTLKKLDASFSREIHPPLPTSLPDGTVHTGTTRSGAHLLPPFSNPGLTIPPNLKPCLRQP